MNYIMQQKGGKLGVSHPQIPFRRAICYKRTILVYRTHAKVLTFCL